MLKTELLKAIKSRKTQYFLLFMIAMLFVNYMAFIGGVFGRTSIELRSQTAMGLMRGGTFDNLRFFLMILLPVIAFGLYADSYALERESGCLSFYDIRISAKKYRLCKGAAIAIINFVVVFVTLMIFDLLTWLAVPDVGIRTGYGLASYVTIHDPVFLDSIACTMPHLYDVILIGLFAFMCACEGVIGYACTLILKDVRRLYMYAGVFVGFSLLNILLPVDFQLPMYIQTYPANLHAATVTLVCWLGVTVLLLMIGVRKDGGKNI